MKYKPISECDQLSGEKENSFTQKEDNALESLGELKENTAQSDNEEDRDNRDQETEDTDEDTDETTEGNEDIDDAESEYDESDKSSQSDEDTNDENFPDDLPEILIKVYPITKQLIHRNPLAYIGIKK